MKSKGPAPRARQTTPHVSLKACREARRLEQADIAAALGIGTDLLSKYETGVRDLPARLLAAFAEAYGVNPDAIVWGAPALSGEDDLPQVAGL